MNLIDGRKERRGATAFPTSVPGVLFSDDGRCQGDDHLHLGFSAGVQDDGCLLDRALHLVLVRCHQLQRSIMVGDTR